MRAICHFSYLANFFFITHRYFFNAYLIKSGFAKLHEIAHLDILKLNYLSIFICFPC